MAHRFKPGNTFSKGKGRPKGSRDRISILHGKFATFLDKEFDAFWFSYQHLKPLEQVKTYAAIAQYVLPKKREASINHFENLSDDSLKVLYNKVVNGLTADAETISIEPAAPAVRTVKKLTLNL